MNGLSLFDGMSCGQIALEKLGIKVDKYFASEIDKYAIQVTQSNYPNTIQVGGVEFVTKEMINHKIGLLYGGSPCQSFSKAGNGKGFDGKSKLFWEFVRVLKETKPTYFLLENVVMKKEWEQVITDTLGVEPIKINSSLVSAQNRNRLYWTNIQNINQPKDEGVALKDITEKGLTGLELELSRGNLSFIPVDKHSSKNGLICLGGVMKPNSKLWLNNGKLLQRNFPQGNRVYSEKGKTPTLSANSGGIGGKTGLYEIEGVIRKLTPIECERLQTVPDNYTNYVSDTQRYKMLGNGWTVDVIAHIFKSLS